MAEARPWKITFVASEACNLRCRHCHAWRTGDTRRLPTGRILAAIEELNGWVGDYKLFLAGGEPTLRDDLPAITAAAAGHGNLVSLATNGTRLDEAAAEALVRAGLGHADVALDAPDATVHDHMRGVAGTHALAVGAIERLDRQRRRHGRRMYINAAAVVCRDTLAGLPELVRFAPAHGADRLLLQPIAPPFWSRLDQAWLQRSDLWPDDPAEVHRVIDELVEIKRADGPLDNDVEQLEGMRAYLTAPPPAAPATPAPDDRIDRCRVGQMALNVNHRGDVRLCHNMPPVGDLTRDSLRDIWTSRRAVEARERIARCHEGCYLLNCNFCD